MPVQIEIQEENKINRKKKRIEGHMPPEASIYRKGLEGSRLCCEYVNCEQDRKREIGRKCKVK